MSEKLSSQMDLSCSETMLPETLLRKDSPARIKRLVITFMSEVMALSWVQAVFRFSDGSNSSFSKEAEANNLDSDNIGQEIKQNNMNAGLNDSSIDLSEGVAVDMFGILPSSEYEIIEINLRGWNFKIRLLSKEYQHTCKSTGLMLWESARLMASVLAENPNIVTGKRVLELGCGCGGICSMIAARYADLVVATDGEDFALTSWPKMLHLILSHHC